MPFNPSSIEIAMPLSQTYRYDLALKVFFAAANIEVGGPGIRFVLSVGRCLEDAADAGCVDVDGADAPSGSGISTTTYG